MNQNRLLEGNDFKTVYVNFLENFADFHIEMKI